jgi:predicted TIM-barrel enzyme
MLNMTCKVEAFKLKVFKKVGIFMGVEHTDLYRINNKILKQIKEFNILVLAVVYNH